MANVPLLKSTRSLLTFLLLAIVAAACQSGPPLPATLTPLVETIAVPSPTEAAIDPTAVPPSPTLPPADPRSLVICTGQEPADLYLYGSYGADSNSIRGKNNILAAIYDGPFEILSYEYRPVILEKVPNLSDGDAALERVAVNPGEPIVDADGNIAPLEPGVRFFPSGCKRSECVQEYTAADGSAMLDRIVVTFRLLPGLTWSDGAPLTAADSVYSFEMAADPASPVAKDAIERTASYLRIDDQTVQWSGLPGYRDPTYFANFWTPLPQHLWGQLTAAELLEAEVSSRLPIGWGPYIIQQWTPGSSIQLAKNPNYFRANEGLPVFDFLVFRFVDHRSPTSVANLLSGECDILDRTVELDDEQVNLLALDQNGQIRAFFQTSRAWEHADFGIVPNSFDDGWNLFTDRPDLFGDVRVRQATAFCMNRQAVVDSVLVGRSVVLDTYLAPEHPLYHSDVPQYAFDVEAGIALLEEAGWLDTDQDPQTPRLFTGNHPQIPPGTPLEFNYATSSAEQRLQSAQILIDSLAECGIKANLELWPISELTAPGPDGPIFGRRFEMGQFAWENDVFTPFCDLYMSRFIAGGDIERFPFFWGGWNNPGYSNPEYDAVCEAALQSLPGDPEYEANHRQAQEIFAQELPVVPLYLHLKLAAARPDICNFMMDPTAKSDMWNLEAFDYGESCQQ